MARNSTLARITSIHSCLSVDTVGQLVEEDHDLAAPVQAALHDPTPSERWYDDWDDCGGRARASRRTKTTGENADVCGCGPHVQGSEGVRDGLPCSEFPLSTQPTRMESCR